MKTAKQPRGSKFWVAATCGVAALVLVLMAWHGYPWVQICLVLGLVISAGILLWFNHTRASREQRLHTVAQTILCCGLIFLPLDEVPEGLDTFLAAACVAYLIIMGYLGWRQHVVREF
ncbi:hypothetical protein [Neolewinella litorea]|uniref:Uncharacterized protein n=1 Tax=Neolewinella litorea TaxID=2562452 RepID=A0A4S4NNM1_9BACT|nr:hypothetical protein [Neolewinella litorea]THH40617.1 hypothetical protein E4021_07760 [Neolewinella litorea]